VKTLRRVLLILGGLALLLVAALGVTLALLDIDGLIERYKPKAMAAASEAVGRPVRVGAVETQWFPNLAIVAGDLEVESSTVAADAPPLLEVESLRLSLALWPAIRSLGKEIRFSEIAVIEPTARIEQRSDGTWNFSDLGGEPAEAPPEPESEEQITSEERRGFVDYLEKAEIGRVAIEGGTVLYDDPDRSLALRQLDFEIFDVALGAPIDARLAFALGADEQNVGLTMKTKPLPENLLAFIPPAIETGSVEIERLPLSGFLPAVEGYDLQRAALDASIDLAIDEGSISISGPIDLSPIRWVSGGAHGADFGIGTRVDATYATEDPSVVLDGTIVRLGPIDLEISGRTGLEPALSADLRLETRRATKLSDLGPLAAGLGGLPGAALTVTAEVRMKDDVLELPSLLVGLGEARIASRVSYPLGDTGRIEASFETGETDLAALVKDFDIEGVRLPDGSALSVKGRYGAPVAKAADGTLKIDGIEFAAGESQLTASGEVTKFSPVAARLEGRSPFLDLDALLPAAEEQEEESAPPAEQPSETSGLEGVRITTDLRVDRIRYSGVTARDARARIAIRDERVVLEVLRFDVFGGRISASGTTLDLSRDPIGYDVAAKLSSLRASEVLRFVSEPLGGVLDGELSTDLDLSGAGFDTASIAKTLSGSLSMSLAQGQLSGVNLVESAAGPLVSALEVAELEPSKSLATDFSRLAASFSVQDGRFVSRRPIRFDTPSGEIELGGDIGLDQSLDLSGDVKLSPDFVRSITGGKIRPSKAVPVGLRLGCSLTKPCVKGVDAESTASSLLRSATAAVAKEAEEKVREEVDEKKEVLEQKARKEAKEAKKKVKKKAKEKVEEGLDSLFGR